MVRLADLPDYEREHLLAKNMPPLGPAVWTAAEKPLSGMRVALITTAGLHYRGDEPFPVVDLAVPQTGLEVLHQHRAGSRAVALPQLVAVHAISGRDTTRLAGTTVSNESTDRAAILATLQATDRWVRGHME